MDKDMLDEKLWKKIQDSFSESIKSLVYTIDNGGNEITKSKAFPFFCQLIKSKDDSICKNCCVEALEKLKKEGKDLIPYYCHAGLLNIIAPIKIKGKQIGAVICGAILKDKPDESLYKEFGKNIGIDEELADAVKSIPIIKEGEIKGYFALVSALAKTMPELVYQKVIGERRIDELSILHKIAQIISHMSELGETFGKIKDYIKKIDYIEDCSIMLFDNGIGEESKKEVEEIVRKEIISLKTLVKIKKEELRLKGLKYLPYEIIAAPLIVNDNIVGFVAFYSFSIDKISEEDTNFLWILADQISIAVLNARNLEQIKNKAITDKLTGLYNREFFMNILKMNIS
ncbi:MAG: PocR ligand-binding domain-containing protein, partial [Nanoarchaeota archaeon]|nr:PocR ligand-binding domain-containing protein [Nanoarchaeota archaeon]